MAEAREERERRGYNWGKCQDHSLSYQWVKKLQTIQKEIYLLGRLHRVITVKRQKTDTWIRREKPEKNLIVIDIKISDKDFSLFSICYGATLRTLYADLI